MVKLNNSITIPIFTIPTASIAINGDISDWASVAEFINDPGIDEDGTGYPSWADIVSVKIATDAGKTKLYFLIKNIANITPVNTSDYDMRIEISTNILGEYRRISLAYGNNSIWSLYKEVNNAWEQDTTGSFNVTGQYMEIGIDVPAFSAAQWSIEIYNGGYGFSGIDEVNYFGYVKLP